MSDPDEPLHALTTEPLHALTTEPLLALTTEPLLALETATSPGSVALLSGVGVALERALPAGAATAETLLPAIDALLGAAGVPLAAIRGLAVSIGPGSFTGLRIGVATVKGLAFGASLPVAAVPTLAALALRAPPGGGPVIAVLDARRGEVYAAGYTEPGRTLPDALPEGVYGAEELAARLPPSCRLVGEGVAVCGEAVRRGRGAGAVAAAAGEQPRALDVARLARALFARGVASTAADLVPRYVRRAEAEAKRTGSATEPRDG
jgi:tRNA threonylcarbamoyladenosine biosynthesis protein TsaB